MPPPDPSHHERFMRRALVLARRAYGRTSPNPMVGAVLVRGGEVLGEGWHHAAGQPHAEIEALRDAERKGHHPRGATLHVTLEPCCTRGRTPPCTDAILAAGIRTVVVGTSDPNPRHAGQGLAILAAAGVQVRASPLELRATELNEAFNHWIVHRTPFVIVKAALTLDGKIATRTGDSKWITGERARAAGMRLRRGSDAILVGVNTVLADDAGLTIRSTSGQRMAASRLRRIILDGRARTPPGARVVTDADAELTTVVVTDRAPKRRVNALAERVRVWMAPTGEAGEVDLEWLLRRLGEEAVCQLLVEGGGEVNAAFLMGGRAHRVAFFYGPRIIGDARAIRGVAGAGARDSSEVLQLSAVRWRQLGPDLFMTARVDSAAVERA